MCPETSVTNYQITPRIIPEERRPWLMAVGCCNVPTYSLQIIGDGNTQQSGETLTKMYVFSLRKTCGVRGSEVRNGRLSAKARFELSYSYLQYTDRTDGHDLSVRHSTHHLAPRAIRKADITRA
jgi:hypothetical protein